MATAKQVAVEIVGSLPNECTLKDAAYRIDIRELLEEAREDSARAGSSRRKKSSGKPPGGSSRRVGWVGEDPRLAVECIRRDSPETIDAFRKGFQVA